VLPRTRTQDICGHVIISSGVMDTDTHAETVEAEHNNITNAKIATGNIFFALFILPLFGV